MGECQGYRRGEGSAELLLGSDCVLSPVPTALLQIIYYFIRIWPLSGYYSTFVHECQEKSAASCILELVWKQSGREIVPEANKIVYRLLGRPRAGARLGFTRRSVDKGAQGRHKACPYRSIGGEHCWLATFLGNNEHGGEKRRGVARGHNCRDQGSGVRGQGSVVIEFLPDFGEVLASGCD